MSQTQLFLLMWLQICPGFFISHYSIWFQYPSFSVNTISMVDNASLVSLLLDVEDISIFPWCNDARLQTSCMSIYPIISLGLNTTRSCLLFSVHWASKGHCLCCLLKKSRCSPVTSTRHHYLLLLIPLFFLWGSRAWEHSRGTVILSFSPRSLLFCLFEMPACRTFAFVFKYNKHFHLCILLLWS